MSECYQDRITAIRCYLEGEAPIDIYTRLGYSSAWFFKWRLRYLLYGFDGLKDLPKAPKHQAKQTSAALEQAIVHIRQSREKREREETKYAFIGADAIHKELQEFGYVPPSVRTVHNILVRHGLVKPPPAPQSVKEVIDRHYPSLTITSPGQMQQLDLVGPRYLQGSSQRLYFYNLRDVCSRRVAVDVGKNHQANTIVQALIRAWQRMGSPTILQHDNALEFRGSNQHPRSAGLLTKLCLTLGIESLFIPAREPYRNGCIENFNGLFQQLVLATQRIKDFSHLQREIQLFERVANLEHPHRPLAGKTSAEYEQSVQFQPRRFASTFTFGPTFRFSEPPEGKVSFICRIRPSGKITIATETFEIDDRLAWDYVYASIGVHEKTLRVYHKGEEITTFPYELNI